MHWVFGATGFSFLLWDAKTVPYEGVAQFSVLDHLGNFQGALR
jgi:hypothetical protein